MQGAVSLPARVVEKRCYRVKDHENHSIHFKTWGATRPMLERKHSESIQEDIRIGWREWERKSVNRTHSEPQLGHGHQERSQSMPIVPKGSTTPVKEDLDSSPEPVITDPKDLEPELESKSLAICAPIISGTLSYDVITGTYSFSVRPNSTANHAVTDAILLEDDTSVSAAITLAAFPDTILTPVNIFPNTLNITPNAVQLLPRQSYFFVLTATSRTVKLDPMGLGIDFDDSDYDSDNEPDLPEQTTYSGTGVMIMPTSEYLIKHDHFVNEIAKAEAKMAEAEDLWNFKSARAEVDGLGRWFGEMWQEEHWRRIGAVEFNEWSEEVWERVMGREIWDVMRMQQDPLRPRLDRTQAMTDSYQSGWGKKFWLD